ncbi:MAG: adenylyltransferase/cytidyltransferase family protein [Candidatus Latescibacterota bacterium]|jgi:FAD synthetase
MAKRVLCCGTFDYLHPGHEAFLKQASALGDELVVVVARDENVYRIKGHFPDHDEESRRKNIENLGIASWVQLGYAGANLLKVVEDISPAIIALGYDQGKPAGLHEHFPDCRIIVLDPYQPERYKSSFIRQKQAGE